MTKEMNGKIQEAIDLLREVLDKLEEDSEELDMDLAGMEDSDFSGVDPDDIQDPKYTKKSEEMDTLETDIDAIEEALDCLFPFVDDYDE